MPAVAERPRTARVADTVAFAVLAVAQVALSVLAVLTIASDQLQFEECTRRPLLSCDNGAVFYGTQVVTITVAAAAAATLVASLLRSRRRHLLFWIPLAAMVLVVAATVAGLAITRATAGAF